MARTDDKRAAHTDAYVAIVIPIITEDDQLVVYIPKQHSVARSFLLCDQAGQVVHGKVEHGVQVPAS